ncbi:MAG TPA: class I SAM-dependent RNA methyltransferase [Sediminispirochaeta sp.]|nr:class I SAM-dependent RNA methyltransferase [Sediminispirochaeta sp.]
MTEEYHIHIDDLAFGGDGVGSISAPGEELDGIRCFVPFSAPGDMLKVRLGARKKRLVRGEILEIVEASPLRRPPVCPYFGRCGACSWQHIDYRAQLEAKRNILTWNLRRLAGLALEPSRLIASPKEFGYRSRLRMRVSANGRLAFHQANSSSLVEIDRCPLAVEGLNGFLEQANRGDPELPKGGTVLIQDRRGTVKWEVEARRGVRGSQASIAFYQANDGVNELLRRELKELCLSSVDSPEDLRLLDLYCGNGNLSLPLAEAGAEVVGVDSGRKAVKIAKNRARRYTNAGYYRLDAREAIRGMRSGEFQPFGGRSPEVVLLDPPRGGLGTEEMTEIYQTALRRIVYVSCDSATLARDLRQAAEHGWRVEEALLFDMFPQTSHFESVVLLRKTN